MRRLTSCSRCQGFLPVGARRCPHCDAGLAKKLEVGKKLLGVAGSGAFALTLMACYGAPPGYHGVDGVAQPPAGGCNTAADDLDGDGYCAPADCDEIDFAIHPDAEDPPNDGLDQNCDGVDGPTPDVGQGDR